MSQTTLHPADLDPARITERIYVTRRRPRRIDSSSLLSLVIMVLLLFPARFVVPGMSTPGRPALLLALGLCFWWVIARANPRLVLVGPQPIRWALYIYLLSILGSYAIGYLRGLTSMEANSADRWILGTLSLCGIVLAAADGIPNWERLRGVLRVFVWCSAFVAVFGLLQFLLQRDLIEYLTVPGFESVGSTPDLMARGASVRVASTTTHYIELSAVLAMALPFAVHFARFDPSARKRRYFAVAAVLMAIGNVVTFSRTGLIAIVIAALFVMPLWTWRLRYNILVLCVAMLACLSIAKPSISATLLSMFTGASNDLSITSRTQRYDMVGYYFAQRPWFGRGTGTWVPPMYQYLDNQWLSMALTNGLIGVFALAALHIVAIAVASIALRRARTPEDKHLIAAILSMQAIAIFVAATFDSLWYSTYVMVLGLMIGLCGTVWRLTHPTQSVRTSAPRWSEK